MPKGVIWTHHDLREITLAPARMMGPVPRPWRSSPPPPARPAPAGAPCPLRP
uniref:Uncharacterized protein n=1 Tax=Phenylobacterium glaciei TaxID=2803784 RepID=A0A974P225_9CAUL|nr:hypothetical protein JKL49_21725 [Phenylobacterium glaciei]